MLTDTSGNKSYRTMLATKFNQAFNEHMGKRINVHVGIFVEPATHQRSCYE